nr:CHAD domain-containing protein [Verrucomicrobium sp. GAS474]
MKRGLKRLYRRWKRALTRAELKRSDIRLHIWRKRTKDLAYALHLLGLRNSKLEEKALQLENHLGNDHDLALLQKTASFRSESKILRRFTREARREHQEKAFRLGHRLLYDSPKHFIRHLA